MNEAKLIAFGWRAVQVLIVCGVTVVVALTGGIVYGILHLCFGV